MAFRLPDLLLLLLLTFHVVLFVLSHRQSTESSTEQRLSSLNTLRSPESEGVFLLLLWEDCGTSRIPGEAVEELGVLAVDWKDLLGPDCLQCLA